jgi:SAM-dependent methyltransferase
MNGSTKSTTGVPAVHLCIMQPVGYVHSMGLLDAALYFRHQLVRLGAQVSIAKNRLRQDCVNMIFGAHLGFDAELARSFCCVFVNLEQLGAGGSRMPPAYLELLRGFPVIDYDAANPPTYKARSGEVPLISFGHAPYLASGPIQPLPLDQRPFDLLFFGSMNPRRRAIIERIERTGRTVVTFDAPLYGPERDVFIRQSRAVLNCHHYDSALFEQVRAFHVLSLGTPFVSERTERTCPGAQFEPCVNWFTDANLERFFAEEYAAASFAERAAKQLEAFRAVDPVAEFAKVVDHARASQSSWRSQARAPVNPQRLLQIGSGKDYRSGWLNVDILERAQPDIVVDLSQRQAWPRRFASPTWGTVELREGASDLIYANNVLEHVPDLATLMGNCLALLRVGGLMVIEVPHESSTGAWQDPTHVRAMNENSWIYYTDWFWYLGWFEHRFRLRQFQYIDDKRAPCDKSRAAFMTVTLEKIPTTVAERMTARTMSPDFAGLIDSPSRLCGASEDTGPPSPATLAIAAAPRLVA